MNASPRMGRGEVFSLEFLVQGGAGEFEKDEIQTPHPHCGVKRNIHSSSQIRKSLGGGARNAQWCMVVYQREYSKSRIMNRFKKIKRLKIGQAIRILSNPTLCGVF